MMNKDAEIKWITPLDQHPSRRERRANFKKLREKLGSRVWHERINKLALEQQKARHMKKLIAKVKGKAQGEGQKNA